MDDDDDLLAECRDLAAKIDPPPLHLVRNLKEMGANSATLDTDAWWEAELARAQEQWDWAKTLPHTGAENVCDVCWAGDGDARCQRCGCSVGHPGCQCAEGYLAGPCVSEFEKATRAGHYRNHVEEP